ncbi:MAG: phage tail sheath protein [Gemmatimonadales bacterium]|nr:MAG: phage tail sheath protein [Gemmatimonadales bacterium]
MTTFLTPGVYLRPAERVRPVGALVRTDVALFVGYTRRGPAFRPVRVEAWREFLAHFGEPTAVGYLAPAVRAFFENGGATCWVVRVLREEGSGGTAGTAHLLSDPVPLAGGDLRWRFSASFNEALLDEPEGMGLHDALAGSAVRRTPNPGTWGNQLALTVSPDVAFRTVHEPGRLEEGWVSRVRGLSGLHPRAVVRLRQEGAGERVAEVREVDRIRNRVTWAEPLPALGLDPDRSIRIESSDLLVRIALGGRVVEEFRRLGIHPEHPRSILRVIPRESRWIDVALELPDGIRPSHLTWTDPSFWPLGLEGPLTGGADGLTQVGARDFRRGLASSRGVDEIALVTAPDLVLRAEPAPSRPPAPAPPPACESLEPPPRGVVFARVVTRFEGPGEDRPVAGVEVVEAASGRRALTDADGEFLLEGVDPELVTLRLEKGGFETLEVPVQAEPSRPATPVSLFLAPLLVPRALDPEEILEVQQAMAHPTDEGTRLYRFALLDPPAPEMDAQEILSWRARLGDVSTGALYYPWVGVGGGAGWIPPSGHVAGVTAAADRREGPHRSPANQPLALVQDLSVQVGDEVQGLLNPAGVNCIRAFPGRGIRLYGTRTLSSDPEWRYTTVRRLVLALGETLEKAFQWAVFEPNDTLRRQALSMSITALLERLRRGGALAGDTPDAAYRVKCDEDNNPPRRRDTGMLLAEIAVAPSIPYEFVVFRLGRSGDALEVTE